MLHFSTCESFRVTDFILELRFSLVFSDLSQKTGVAALKAQT